MVPNVIDGLVDCSIDDLLGHTLGLLRGSIYTVKQPAEGLLPNFANGRLFEQAALGGSDRNQFILIQSSTEQNSAARRIAGERSST